jgi:aspartate aminotransferase
MTPRLPLDTSAHFSPVAASLSSSCLHEIFRAAEARELSSDTPVLKLHVGEPYFEPPPSVPEALVAAVRRGDTSYTSVEGLLPLRERLAAKLAEDNSVDASPSRIFVTPGSCQGLTALLRSIAQLGDEILLPELHWPVHVQQAVLAGFRPVFYPLDTAFRPDPVAVAAAAGPRTRVLLLNTPANPTGAVMDAALLSELLELSRRHGWDVISDEAYEHFVFDQEHVSLASLEQGVPRSERIVHSVFSFSKSMAMTGYRLGYVVTATEQAATAMRVVQEASIISPSTPVQYAGIAAVDDRRAALANRELVMRNRNRALPRLVDAGLLRFLPAGGWYAMLDVAGAGMDSETFSARLFDERSVAVVPGSGFAPHPEPGRPAQAGLRPAGWANGLVRIAFCVEPQTLDEAVDRIIDFVSDGR